jgi:hypothetical protein
MSKINKIKISVLYKMEVNTFTIVKQIRLDINNIFIEIDAKLQSLTQIYEDLIKTHHDKNYTLGLDSFHFQNKLIQLEYDNMKNVFNFIDNRIYCEYYKLHRMLFEFINKEIKEKTFVDKLLILYKKYPIYKDLEPTKIYDFNITIEINNTIIHVLAELKTYLADKKTELGEKKKQSDMGINIQSILHEQAYHNVLLEERIHMFENYLTTFNNHHAKYFSRLTIKMKLMLGIVNEDFNLKKKKSKRHLAAASGAVASGAVAAQEPDNVSSSSSEVSTPKTSMTEGEEHSVRLLIGAADAQHEIQSELNIILRHIPHDESELMETKGLRDTIVVADV